MRQTHSELALLFPHWEIVLWIWHRMPVWGGKAKSMDMVAFSPPSQRVPCFSVSLPLWENCESVKFPSLSPEHFIYQGAKLGTEPPLTQLMNDSVFSGQLLPAHCLTVMPSCIGVPCCPRCYVTPVQGAVSESERKNSEGNQDQHVFLEEEKLNAGHLSALFLGWFA